MSRIAYYPLNEKSGTSITDQSGFGAALNLSVTDGNITWVSGRNGILTTASATIKSTGAPTKIYDAVLASGVISVECWIKPSNITQTGPARIISLSASVGSRNLTLAQDTNTIVGRFRTSTTSTNGEPPLIAGTVTTTEMHYIMTWDGTTKRLYENGHEVATQALSGSLNWDTTHPLMLVNEATNDRAWLGELYTAAIYDNVLTPAEVLQNYTLGSHVPVLSLQSIGQNSSIENSTLSINTDIIVQNLGQTQTGSTPILGISMLVNSLAQAQGVTSNVIYAGSSISLYDLTQASNIDTLLLTASTVGTGTPASVYIIAPTGYATIVNPEASTNDFLIYDVFYTGNDLILGVDIELFMYALSQEQNLDNIVPVQANNLVMVNIQQAAATDLINLTQSNALAIDSILQAQSLSTCILNQDTFIFIDNVIQGQSISPINLIEQAILNLNSLIQVMDFENIELLQNNFLSIDNISSLAIYSEPEVAQSYILVLQNITSFQSLDNIIILTYDNYTIGRLVYVLENEKIIHVLEN